jgi:dipeptidyl aminopeptidase/acylaminoacyl peptidase
MRRGLLSLIVLFLATGVRSAEVDPLKPPAVETTDVRAIPRDLSRRLSQYLHFRTATFHGWAPDGRGMLITTRFGNTPQLHRVYEPGGRREQLTFADEPVTGRFLRHAPDSAILFLMSRGGSEADQVYFLEPASGRTTQLTDGRSRNLLEAMAPDGSRVIIGNNSRNGRDTDLYIADPRTKGSLKVLLQTNGEYWTADDWSPDGARVLISRYVSINESHPELLTIATRVRQPLTPPAAAPSAFDSLRFSADGKGIYFASDAHSEFLQLARLDLQSLRYTWLTGEIPWNVEAVAVARQGGGVAFTVNQEGTSRLYVLENDKARPIEVPAGIIAGLEFSPAEDRLGFTLAQSDAPADAYSLSLADRKLVRWTYSELGGLNPQSFVRPRTIHFASFDGRQIPAFLFKPRHASRSKPVPVLIQIHGGPESQYRPFFTGTEQFYVNEMGFAVIAPNVRGSAGYGKEYLKLDNAEKREDSVRDIGALLDWIAMQPDLDAKRVAVMGGSYGGYMVLAALTHYSDRIRAGVDIVGVGSFNTMLKTTSAYRRDLRRAEYGDERDPKMQAYFQRIDPLNNAMNIRSALLVAHGRNDPRVPFTEAQQIVAKVRANGKTVWTVYAANEGHGFRKKANRDYLNAVIALFLRDHLADGP